MIRALVVTAVALAAASTVSAAAPPRITVFAAASLTDAFPKIDKHSAVLVRRLERARGADRGGGAGGRLRLREHDACRRQLFDKKLCTKPVVFTKNKLVVIVPRRTQRTSEVLRPDQARCEDRDRQPGVSRWATTRCRCSQPSTLRPDHGERGQPGERRPRGAGQDRPASRPTPASSTRTDAKAVADDVKMITIPKDARADGSSTASASSRRQPHDRGRAGIRQEGAVEEGTGEASRLRIPAAQVKRVLLAIGRGHRHIRALCFPRAADRRDLSCTRRPATLVDQFSSRAVEDAFVVTLEDDPDRAGLIILFGTPTAYLLATRRFRCTVARDHARRTSARAATRRGRDRPARRLRPQWPARLDVRPLASRSRSRRWPSSWPWLSSRPRSTSRQAIAAFRDASIRSRRRLAHAWRRHRAHVRPRHPPACPRGPRSPASRSRSPAASASSERRSCSPAASRA